MSSNQVSLIYCVVLYKVCIISCIVVFVTNVQHDDYSWNTVFEKGRYTAHNSINVSN